MSRAKTKTKTNVATIKPTPHCRTAWEATAEYERRTLSGMIEVAIFFYCEEQGIEVPREPVKTARRPAARKVASHA